MAQAPEDPRRQHRQAFEKFDDFLTLRQQGAAGEDGTDIREKVLALRTKPWSIGYAAFNLTEAYAANMRLLWPDLAPFDTPQATQAQNHLLMGTIYADPANSHIGSIATLEHYEPAHELLLGEQGFLASTHSWSEAFRTKDPQLGCLGYVYDDISYYFMADYPNRLIHRLNSDHALSRDETVRARGLIDRIVTNRVSKYNSQPIVAPTMTRGYKKRVLVCDQTYGDASTVFGKIDESGFEAMLLAALAENPDAEVLVKTHPDTSWEKEKRIGYYNHLADTARVKILRAPINPYMLFEQVEKVYVGTSQIGLEALFAGKEVVCFGAPFYAGWGLTDDRQEIPHRHRTRSLEEIFHIFYIWYTIYHVPGAEVIPSQIEDALSYIEQNRPVSLPVPQHKAVAKPKVSIILPVYGVEPYIAECLLSIRNQTLQDIEIITVNDRSPDQSQMVIDLMAAEDLRIRPIVLEKNVGQGFARNIGLEAARGEYVWFLDSDDFMPAPDHLQRVYDCAQNDGADMVRGRKLFEQVEDLEGNILEMRRDRCEIHFDAPFHSETVASAHHILRSRHFCNWLYRRAFLEDNNIRFLTAQWEERPFLLRALLSATAISGTTSEAFVYRIRQDSTARRPKTVRDSFNQLANFEQFTSVLEEFGACDKDSPFAYTAGYMVMQALHILFHGFAYRTVCNSGEGEEITRFLDRAATVLERTGMGFDALVFDAPQISKGRLGSQSYRLLFEALRQRRFVYVDVAINGTAVDQETVMACLLRDPADADEAAFQNALSLYARNERVRTATGLEPLTDKPRLILHVGQTKTGSTYIQHFLEQNRPALLRAGIWVPDTGLFWQEKRPHKQAGHGEMTREAVIGATAIRDHIEAALSLAKGRIHTVILSSEAYFLNPRSARIPDHFPDYKVEMIGYFRRQDDWANSQYAEFVAGGAMGRVSAPFEDWLDEPVTRERLNYYSYCRMWAARIGQEQVHARVYDRASLKKGDIVSDFLAALKLGYMDSLPRPAGRQSNDMPFNTAHILMLREINGYEWPQSMDYLDFIEDVTERIAALNPGDVGGPAKVELITPAQRRRLLNGLASSNADFARVFCPDAREVFAASEIFAHGAEPEGATLGEGDVKAIYEALGSYNPGGKEAPAVALSTEPVLRAPKAQMETVEQLQAMGGILMDVQGLPTQVASGSLFEVDLALFNLSRSQLPKRFRALPVNLSYHILEEGGVQKTAVWNGLRTPLPGAVEYQCLTPLQIEAPQTPGRYLLQAALVVEGQRWFNSHQLWPFEVV